MSDLKRYDMLIDGAWVQAEDGGTFQSFEPASGRVWEGARGLEWTLSSPPPYHSFNTPPPINSSTVAHADEAH
mgnify:CR=1 FL=1